MRRLLALLLLLPGLRAGEIALSFDDAPRWGTRLYDGPARATRMITELERLGVDEVVFFVRTKGMHDEGLERIRRYAMAGHLLANHTHSHWNLHRTETGKWLADVRVADELLRPMEGFVPWFRFPLLNHGKDLAQRDRVRAALTRYGYTEGYVTVDTWDFFLDKRVQDALDAGRSVDMGKLGALYVKVIMDSVRFYDGLARRYLGRSPRHVLLLHENDLAALYMGELVAALRAENWTVISPRRAYEDPLAAEVPGGLDLGEGRIGALVRMGGHEGSIRGRFQGTRELTRAIEESGVFSDP